MLKRLVIVLWLLLIYSLPALTAAEFVQAVYNNSSNSVIVAVENDDITGTQIKVEIPGLSILKVDYDFQTYERFDLEGEVSTAREGWPELPVVSRTVLAPPTAHVRLVVNNVDSHIERNLSPFIVPDYEISENVDLAGEPDAEFLRYDGFWPPDPVMIGEPAILRGYRLVTIKMFPVQYNPSTGETRFNENFNCELVYEDGDAINPVQNPDRPRTSRYAYQAVKSLVVNPPPEPDRDDIQSGSYLYIVPEVNGVDNALAPLIEWRNRQGHKVVVEHLPNNANSGRIGTLIREAYNEWDNPVEFVALV